LLKINWIEEFKIAYELLKEKLYLADGGSFKISHGGNTDYENIDLLNIKLEIDKNRNKHEFDYKYWTLKIYNLLRIKIEVFEEALI